MRCKVADSLQDVEPVTWRSVGPARRETTISHEERGEGAQAHEVAKLRAELMECERRHQAEVAQARREAASESYRQAREEAAAELNAAQNQIAGSLADLAETKRKLRNDAEGELIKLSLAIARRILYREI